MQNTIKTLNVAIILLLRLFSFEIANCQNSLPTEAEVEELKSLLREARSFEDIFIFNRQIEFKSVDIIGQIWQVEANSKGDFLVVDQLSKNIWLFDNEGELIKEMGLEDDYPGVKWLPHGAWFAQDDKILIQIDQTHNLFLFDQKGNFLKAISTHFPPQYTDFVLSKDFIYAYGSDSAKLSVVRMSYDGKLTQKGGIFPERYKNFIRRIPGGGLVIDEHQNIYQYNAPTPQIHKFSPELTHLKTFDRNPPFYKQLTRDFPDFASRPAAFIKQANKILSESTTTFSVHLFKNHFLLIQYLEPKEKGVYLDICNLNGEYYTYHKINYGPPKNIVFKNYIYDTYQPDENAAGDLPNPILREYKLRKI